MDINYSPSHWFYRLEFHFILPAHRKNVTPFIIAMLNITSTTFKFNVDTEHINIGLSFTFDVFSISGLPHILGTGKYLVVAITFFTDIVSVA